MIDINNQPIYATEKKTPAGRPPQKKKKKKTNQLRYRQNEYNKKGKGEESAV